MRKTKLFVVDTNVVISALFFSQSNPAKALLKARAMGLIVVSQEVVSEYFSVISRKKFDRYLPISVRLAFIQALLAQAIPVQIHTDIKKCRDPKDDKYLNLAVCAGAKIIVSGDDDLLILNPFEGIEILTPAQFILYVILRSRLAYKRGILPIQILIW